MDWCEFLITRYCKPFLLGGIERDGISIIAEPNIWRKLKFLITVFKWEVLGIANPADEIMISTAKKF